MLKTLTFHCFLLTLTLLLPVTKPEVECISIDQRIRWQNQLCDLYCIWIFMCPKVALSGLSASHPNTQLVWLGVLPQRWQTPWWPHRPSPRNATILQFFRTTADENSSMTWAADDSCEGLRHPGPLHEIGVTLGQTRSISKGMKAWHVRKLRTTWHVAAVFIHDFFKIHRLNRASLESTWFQSESPLASSFVHFVRFDSRLTFWVYQVLTEFFATSWRTEGWMFFVFEFQNFHLHPIDGRLNAAMAHKKVSSKISLQT